MINLVLNDVSCFKDVGWSMMFFLFVLIEIILFGILFWYLIGWQVFVGVSFFLVVIIYIFVLFRKVGQLWEKVVFVMDECLEIMNEVIGGICVVKMYVWEWNF